MTDNAKKRFAEIDADLFRKQKGQPLTKEDEAELVNLAADVLGLIATRLSIFVAKRAARHDAPTSDGAGIKKASGR